MQVGKRKKKRVPRHVWKRTKPFQRKTRWSHEEAIAWIVARDESAVASIQASARDWSGPTLPNPKGFFLVDMAVAQLKAKPGHWLHSWRGGDWHEGEAELTRAVEAGKIAEERPGLFRVQMVKALWPPVRKGDPFFDSECLHELVEFVLNNSRCLSREGLRGKICGDRYRKETAGLFQKVFSLADDRIARGEDPVVRIEGAELFSPEVAAVYRDNLSSWRNAKPGPIPGKKMRPK